MDQWTSCELCGARMDYDSLAEHQRECRKKARKPAHHPPEGRGAPAPAFQICLGCGDMQAKTASYPTGGGDFDEGCAKCGAEMDFLESPEEAIKELAKERNQYRDAYYDSEGKRLPAPASPAGPWAEYTKAPVPDLNHVYWLVWAARHMVAVCAGRDADIATVSDQAKLLGVLLAKHFATIPDVVGSKAITPAAPEAGAPGTQEGGSQP